MSASTGTLLYPGWGIQAPVSFYWYPSLPGWGIQAHVSFYWYPLPRLRDTGSYKLLLVSFFTRLRDTGSCKLLLVPFFTRLRDTDSCKLLLILLGTLDSCLLTFEVEQPMNIIFSDGYNNDFNWKSMLQDQQLLGSLWNNDNIKFFLRNLQVKNVSYSFWFWRLFFFSSMNDIFSALWEKVSENMFCKKKKKLKKLQFRFICKFSATII